MYSAIAVACEYIIAGGIWKINKHGGRKNKIKGGASRHKCPYFSGRIPPYSTAGIWRGSPVRIRQGALGVGWHPIARLAAGKKLAGGCREKIAVGAPTRERVDGQQVFPIF